MALVTGLVKKTRRTGRFFLCFALSACANFNPLDDYPAKSLWDASSGKVNLSSFVYFDRDLDGTFSVGDRPISGIRVLLQLNGITQDRQLSNINGFANFTSASNPRSTKFPTEGSYTFEVIAPKGWKITSENGRQNRQYSKVSGSISGAALSKLPEPVGLAPPRFDLVTNCQPENGNTGVEAACKIAQSSKFYPTSFGQFPAKTGIPDSSITIDFEDADPSQAGLYKVANNYKGLLWSGFNALSDRFVKNGIGYVNGTVSGRYAIYSSSGHPASVSRIRPFDFIKANLTVAWPKAEGETLLIQFYRGQNMIRQDEVTLSAYHPIIYYPNVANVTEVRFSTKHFWQFVLDDLSVNLN